jgi:hypothetical protein
LVSTPKRNQEEKTEAKVVLSRKQMGDSMLAYSKDRNIEKEDSYTVKKS